MFFYQLINNINQSKFSHLIKTTNQFVTFYELNKSNATNLIAINVVNCHYKLKKK